MNDKPLIYLACPYSHPNPEVRKARYLAVTKVAARLMEENPSRNVFSPITHSHPLHIEGGMSGTWERWKTVDEQYLSVSWCVIVLQLTGWKESTGVQEEIKLAESKGLEVYYVDPDDFGISDVNPDEIFTEQVLSAKDASNPKDRIGSKKVSITKFPFIALLHGAHAMMNGAQKYGAYNWRGSPVRSSIYIDAAIRHLAAWFEGEEQADDSGVHHLAHALACCAILLDAQATNNLIDDRPKDELHAFTAHLKLLNEKIKGS